MNKSFYLIIFSGALWGIVEATAGHFLHVLSIPAGYLIWFPIAFFFLNFVRHATDSPNCMLYAALIAAAIKLTDIFYTTRSDIVINPAISIVLEALAVYVVYRYIMKDKHVPELTDIAACGFTWRIFYLCYLLYVPEGWQGISALSGMVPFVKFFFMETVLNTILILICFSVKEKVCVLYYPLIKFQLFLKKHRIARPLLTFLFLALAVLIQFKL